MEPPAFWRDLQTQFRTLHDPSVDLYAIAIAEGSWYLSARTKAETSTDAMRLQFEALAVRGAVAADLQPHNDPLCAWLDRLKLSPHFKPVERGIEPLRPGERIVEGGWIHGLCVASAEACVLLETAAYVPPPTADVYGAPQDVSEDLMARRRARIQRYRKSNNLSADGFARKVGMSRTAIEGIVKEDRRRYGIATRDQLLAALGLTVEEWYRL